MDTFSIRLRTAIDSRGLQQKSLAAKIKLSPARLSNYVNGHSEPSLDILSLLCQALNVSADYLIGLTDNMDTPTSIPISIPASSIQRDPFSDLTNEQRVAIEATLKAYRELNAKSKEA